MGLVELALLLCSCSVLIYKSLATSHPEDLLFKVEKFCRSEHGRKTFSSLLVNSGCNAWVESQPRRHELASNCKISIVLL